MQLFTSLFTENTNIFTNTKDIKNTNIFTNTKVKKNQVY
jgi:hypothetical protein